MHQSGEMRVERVPASFVRRIVAFLIDGLAIAVVGFAVLAVATVVLGPTVRLRLDAPEAPVAEVLGWRVIVNSALLFVVSAAYFVLSWSRFSFTPGQALLGLTVTSEPPDDRRALAVGPATLRWALLGSPLGLAAALTVEAPLLFLAVAVLSFGWFAALILTTLLSRNGRGLHDRLTGTTVIRRG
jgi:uncharacterized RDD family membrane protein YckC